MNKDSKGFTLIELLTAITILGIITILASVGISRVQTNNRVRQYNTYEQALINAAKLYVDSHKADMFISGNSYEITYSYLTNQNLIKDITVKNVTCNLPNTKVTVTKVGNQYRYAVNLYCVYKDNPTKVVYSTNS